MTSPAYSHVSIAAAGLDLLHSTRLKVACSLLMAERVHADLGAWPRAKVRVLIAVLDNDVGAAAAAEATASGVAVLPLSRTLDAGPGRLRHGATVREMFDQLRDSLLDAPQPDSAPSVAGTLVESVVRSRGVVSLLHLGDIRVAVDADSDHLYAARGLDTDALHRSALQTGWVSTQVSRAEFDAEADRYAPGQSLESFVWCAAAASRVAVGKVPMQQVTRLSAWPAVDAGALPAHWLVALACLMQRPWSASLLANACALPVVDVERIFAAVHHSGLQDMSQSATPTPLPRPAARRAPDGMLQRLARRFGMQFGGARG